MAARKYLNAQQIRTIEAFEARGGSVWVRRRKDGTITISINGFRDISLRDAIAKMAAAA